MKYYLHYSTSFQDEKITKLFMGFGYEGLGLYYTVLEKLALQEKPVAESVLKKQLFIGKRLEKCWNFLHKIDLISTKNGETFSKTLLNFSEKYQVKKEKDRERISKWRENQKDIKNVISNEQVRNEPKEKKKKFITKKNNTKSITEFEKIRKIYPGIKRGLSTEFENYVKKHKDWESEFDKLLPAIEQQINWRKKMKSGNAGFIPEWKHFQTWINQRCWENEMPKVKKIPEPYDYIKYRNEQFLGYTNDEIKKMEKP